MVFSTKRDELGNVSGFMGPIGQRKASVEAKKAQVDTDVLGLNRVLQDTGGNTSRKTLDELTRMMSDCSKAAIDFAHKTDLSEESINSWAEASKKAADDSIKFSTGIKRLGTSLKNLGMQMGATFANMLVAAAVSAAIGVVIDMIDKAVNAAQYAKELIIGDVLIDDGIHNIEGGQYKKVLMTAPHNIQFDAEAHGSFVVTSRIVHIS